MPPPSNETPYPPETLVGPDNVPSNTPLPSRIRGTVMDAIVVDITSGNEAQVSAGLQNRGAAVRAGVANITAESGDVIMEIVAGAAYPDDM